MALVAGRDVTAQDAPVSTLTVTLGQSPESRRIVMAPDSMMTVRYDRGISKVEVANPDLLSVSVGGLGFRDLVLRSGAKLGASVVHVWASDLLMAWHVLVTRSLPQTADFILVRGRKPSGETVQGTPGADARAAVPLSGAASVSASASRDGIQLDAEVRRSSSALLVGYRLRNSGQTAFRLDPVRSVVWLDGRPVQFAVVRSVDSADPMVLAPGASESGTVTVRGSGRFLRLLVALYPDPPGAGRGLVWFDLVFTGIDRLKVQGGGTGERRS